MTKDLITIHNLSYTYPASENYSLQNINLNIPDGSFYTLVGPSGSGKSTLLLLIRGFYQEFGGTLKGKITVENQDINQQPISELGKTMGIVFQNPALQLHQLRVIDEVASAPMYQGLPYNDCLKRAANLVDRVLGRDFYYRSPQELSAGQQQRVAIAASLALDAKILLLDEPFSFLDETARHLLLDLLKELRREGKTIVLATHDISLVAPLSTHMALINNGQLCLSGETKKVLYSSIFPQVMPPPLFVTTAQKAQMKTQPLSWRAILPHIKLKPPLLQPAAQKSAPKTILSLQNVTFTYPSSPNGINNVSLDISEGEIFGLIGHNASGKTTLAKLIMGLLTPKSGKIVLANKDITRKPVFERAKFIGYSTQDPLDMFFESNVWDEAAAGPRLLGLSGPKDLAQIALKQYGLWKYKDVHPDSLSGGEKSRLGIADITVSRQKMLLLDEPEFGLDPKNWAEITNYLGSLKNQGTTTIVITQDLEAALFLCDRIALMADGQIVKVDSAVKILSNDTLLQKARLRSLEFSSLLKKFAEKITKEDFLNSLSEK